MKIDLKCQHTEQNVELTIGFTNTHDANHVLAFSNQGRKAELLGLLVLSEAGERVVPTHNLIIKPTNATLEKHTLTPGATFSYSLVGTLTTDGLVFPGAIFTLKPGETYELRFRCAGRLSNAISLTAPYDMPVS